MAVPTGTALEIFKSPYKEATRLRVKVRLDRPIASTNFVDEFASGPDTALWSIWKPPNTSATVGGGKLTLQSTAGTNGFPVVQSLPGRAFPLDKTIGWTLEFTMDYPTITGFGCFFRVGDLENAEAILAIKNNTADGYTIEMPDGTEIEDLGASHTDSHDYELIYTPATNIAAAQYELKRDTVSKGTIAATGRQAWQIVIGNGSIQSNLGGWTTIQVARVDVNLDSNEATDFPDWTDKETSGGETWGRLPWVNSVSVSTHKRNTVDQAVLSISQGGYVAGIDGDLHGVGYRADMFAGYRWANREIRIETQQSDGSRRTSWTEIFRGLADEPSVVVQNGIPMLTITVRDKVRRRLQMSHTVRGYSDNDVSIDGLVMDKTWTEIIEDLCSVAGLAGGDYNVLSGTLKPRSYQIMGQSILDAIIGIADDGVAAIWRNAGSANPGRFEVQEWSWGTDTPTHTFHIDEDILAMDWAETDRGMTAQVIETVQHSEFSEFSDIYPHAPVPPFGAIIRHNSTIAQTATDINTTRLLQYLRWRVLNRHLNSLVVRLAGQDWIEHDIEIRVRDDRILKLAPDDYWIIDGWDYRWEPMRGLLTTIHLVNQHPEKVIMRAALAQTVDISW